ncbi:MAG: hypothetical protein ACYDHZ_12245, partial [Dehalococcoidia bacterium]
MLGKKYLRQIFLGAGFIVILVALVMGIPGGSWLNLHSATFAANLPENAVGSGGGNQPGGQIQASGVRQPSSGQAALGDTVAYSSVGIGIDPPTAPLHIYSTSSTNPELIQLNGAQPITAMWDDYCNIGGAFSGSGFLARFARGSIASPLDVQSGDRLGFNVFGGWAGGAFRHTAAIEAIVDTGTVSATSLPTYMRFNTTPDGSLGRVERMRIASGGNVSVNAGTDPFAKFYVYNDNITSGNASIIAEMLSGTTTAAVAGWHDSPITYGDLADDVSGVYGANYRSNGTLQTAGELASSGLGVFGFADNTTMWAGYFSGNVNVTGTLTSGVKDFRIDDPLDPANKYLVHSSVESPDMKNIYDGVAVLDNNGEAVVTLPAYFQALN